MSKDTDILSGEGGELPAHWQLVKGSGALHRRFEFANYAAVSAFLETSAELSKETGLYPDISFATTYVNMTIPTSEEDDGTSAQHAFADRSNQIFEEQTT